jgi:hypothetical protein
MPAKLIDRSGLRFGKWTVISLAKKQKYGVFYWNCDCDCGVTKEVSFRSLTSGASTSCGCNAVAKRVEKLTKHGYAGTPTYRSWYSMLQRSLGKGGHESYPERNIGVCQEWHDFEIFLRDMGERPDGCSLDRINNNIGYSKANCRWADQKTQQNNKRTTVYVYTDDGIVTATQAAAILDVGISGIRHRLRDGKLQRASQVDFYEQTINRRTA